MDKMETIKEEQIEENRKMCNNWYEEGRRDMKKDVNKLIDEMMKKKNNEIDVMIWGEKLKARII